MNLNESWKLRLTIAAKVAVNAVLTNSVLMLTLGNVFTIQSWDGIKNIIIATLAVIWGRELSVWLPEILKWSQTNILPNGGDKNG